MMSNFYLFSLTKMDNEKIRRKIHAYLEILRRIKNSKNILLRWGGRGLFLVICRILATIIQPQRARA